jgi:hypothetical protein
MHGSYSPPVQKEISLGNRDYALKQYDKAAEHYGHASELQYVPFHSPYLCA